MCLLNEVNESTSLIFKPPGSWHVSVVAVAKIFFNGQEGCDLTAVNLQHVTCIIISVYNPTATMYMHTCMKWQLTL